MSPTVEDLTVRNGLITVVVADFQPLSAQRSLAAGLAASGARLAVRRIDAVRDLAGTYVYHDLSALADGYAALLGDRPVDCVAGYCSAAGLAERIAVRLGEPPVVLVKPSRPTVRQAVDDFAAFLAKLRATAATEPELPPCGPALHAAMNGRLSAALSAWASADGMDADEVELLEAELLARFDGWLGFLLATAARPDPVPLSRKAVVHGLELDDPVVTATVAAITWIVADERSADVPSAP
ncbi:MAG: hypothetical protein ACRDQ5_07860 [Sciscionella sp.]